ncbi:hypothetical protein [Paraflavitalea speifideaquila]|uniref:hypothetical protein n=1 Tax=Paraflavitalea speifideaquila TaxID=3076558 RepID=UPI0028E92652|nr:hypothetical protein [Paraflavitalea speifideiaquila]
MRPVAGKYPAGYILILGKFPFCPERAGPPLPFVTISAKIAAFLIAFAISFPTGYFLNRNIVFPGSTLQGRVQLFRYFYWW